MSHIDTVIATNSFPQLALPLIESAAVPGERSSLHGQAPVPPLPPYDIVTISPEAAALHKD